MVTLNRIYTRTGDGGSTRLATGEPVSKASIRVDAYGGVDETNAFIGLARLHTGSDAELDALLERIQNDLFDLGADLACPEQHDKPAWEPLRIIPSQVERLEQEIDAMNGRMEPLTSFVLPAGSPAAAARSKTSASLASAKWKWLPTWIGRSPVLSTRIHTTGRPRLRGTGSSPTSTSPGLTGSAGGR